MAYIPSDTLNSYLSSASAGIWLERLADGRIALVCKIPETIIKAIYRGAPTTFLMASVQAESLIILCLGLWVDDEGNRPFKVTMINSSEEDKASLIQLLEAHAVTLHCVNELNHPALSASCSLSQTRPPRRPPLSEHLITSILTPAFSNTISMQDLTRILGLALDRFQAHIHAPVAARHTTEVGFTARVPMSLDIWEPTETFEATPTSVSGPFMIGDAAEGAKLEHMILAVLDSVYPGRASSSPR